ncbi:MAG: hypothetical protein IT515_17540 [Burkholderiales bacterium]|nr:hypothetical protein [Burkholderiales bacterium]
MSARPVRDVPMWVRACAAAGLAAQIGWAALQPHPSATAEDLPQPPSPGVARLLALGEPVAAAKLAMLYLQAFDYQAGTRVPYRKLDYDALIGWLDVILGLDPAGQYPLMAAARTYADVPDPVRSRKMLEFVYRAYFADPNRRWPWLAHAAIIAKHELKDLPLALRFADALEKNTTTPSAPLWVRQMVPFILADMGELEQARILIGGLIASGQVRDARDAEMLQRRLEMIEKRLADQSSKPSKPSPQGAPERSLKQP